MNEYTLFCGKKITASKEEIDYFKDELTPTLEACLNKCPDEKIRGRIDLCPVFLKANLSEYTFICGKKVTLTKEEWEYVNEPLTSAMEVCMHKCPDKEIEGNINRCPDYLKADAEEYSDDPTYQECVKSKLSNKGPAQNSHRQKTTQKKTSQRNNH